MFRITMAVFARNGQLSQRCRTFGYFLSETAAGDCESLVRIVREWFDIFEEKL